MRDRRGQGGLIAVRVFFLLATWPATRKPHRLFSSLRLLGEVGWGGGGRANLGNAEPHILPGAAWSPSYQHRKKRRPSHKRVEHGRYCSPLLDSESIISEHSHSSSQKEEGELSEEEPIDTSTQTRLFPQKSLHKLLLKVLKILTILEETKT